MKDEALSLPVTFNVTQFITSLGFNPTSAVELTLTANKLKKQQKYLQWSTDDEVRAHIHTNPSLTFHPHSVFHRRPPSSRLPTLTSSYPRGSSL
jgi:hypothetical protein